ncbi:hypothetical protein SELMODRAFT_403360 [Selaginella moellendorffii]|uniref:Prolyl 4-hydroxylase alpha subunit Fe(2+) 2OG dioxygenase domain-containing protein n=1 Tax=Selaginella moellendorffii TaxID=88036 RepID=D8QTX5_SELML|nr:hypothetical protein SELMODRAFT_403360 [Selaginella moellendorffii]
MAVEQLNKALWCDREIFATGGEIDVAKFRMPASLHVEGAERISLPLSPLGLAKIKSVSQQAPYGLGERTLVDTDVRRAWQINPDKVSCPDVPNFFSSVARDLAAHGLAAMGLDSTALELDVKLYKLLLYEAGGHFKFHRDTEKEDGMFATMILQLPTSTGHSGAALAVRQGRQCCEFDFSDGSSSHYFSTIFFCDCEHQLKEVTSGSRLCLVFSLVRNNVEFIPAENVPSFVSALPRVRALFQQWAAGTGDDQAEGDDIDDDNQDDDMKDDDDEDHSNDDKEDVQDVSKRDRKGRKLLAVPLAHKYSKTSLSFAGLKGHDRVVAALVRACEFLELHLCMLTKHKIAVDEPEVEYVIDNWITVDDQPAKFKKWNIDVKQEVLRASAKTAKTDYDYDDEDADAISEIDLFDFLEDEFQGGMLAGNEGGTDQYFYHVAVLVVWPKDSFMRTICSSLEDVAWVLDWMRETYGSDFAAPGSPSRGHLQEIVTSLTHRFDSLASLLERDYYSFEEKQELFQDPAKLLEVCVKSGLSDEVLSIMRSWGVELIDTKEFAIAVQAYGWEACKEIIAGVIERVEKTPPRKQVSFLRQDKGGEAPAWHAAVMKLGGFPSRLRDQVGYQDGAIGAAKLLCAKLIAISTELPAEFQDSYKRKREDDGIMLLVDFCLESGLQEEASQILAKLTLPRLRGGTLAKVMHYFPSRTSEVEGAWDERKKMAEAKAKAEKENRSSYYDYVYSGSKGLCEAYVGDMVEFMLELESLGHHDEALRFAARPFPCDCATQKLTDPGRTSLQEHWIVVALLLKPEVILGDYILGEYHRCAAINMIQKAAGLVGLKNNEAAKKVLVKLCKDEVVATADIAEMSSWIEYHGATSSSRQKDRFYDDVDSEEKVYKTWKKQKKFFELLLWLEDEELLGAMVECVSKRANLLRRMLEREEELVKEAVNLGDGVKRAMKKLVEVRMEYVSREPSLGDVVESLTPASKRLKLCGEVDVRQAIDNPRQQRRVYEMVVENWKGDSAARLIEIEKLQALYQML